MKKLSLIFVALILAILAVGQTSTLIEYPYVVKHMSNKDQIFTGTPGKYFVGYSTISQGDSVLYYSTSGLPTGLGTYSSPLPIDSINTLQSNGKKVLARIKRGDTYGVITIADSNIVVCSYSTVNTTAKPVINYIDNNGKANVEVKNIDQTYNGYYFISNSGNNSYPGTSPDSAWATIAKVNTSTFEAGDNILFKGGDEWRGESLTIGWSGTEANPIVIGAYGTGAKPIFNGAEVATGWIERRTNLWVKKAPLSEPFRTVVVIDGDLFYPKATLAAVDADLEYFVEDSTGTNGDSIYVYSETDPSTRTAELSTRIFGIQDGLTPDAVSANITIKDLEFRYYGYAGTDARGTQANGNFLVDNCTFYHNREFAVHFYDGHSNNTVQNCTVSYCGNGLYSNQNANYNSFIGNTITNTFSYTGLAFGNTDGHAIGVYDSNNGLVESNYIAYGNTALIGLDEADAVIRYNEVHSTGTASNPGQALASFTVNSGDTLDIYYNLFYGEVPYGSCMKFTTTNGKANIYNNTLVAYTGEEIIDMNTVANIELKNNILHNIGTSKTILDVVTGTSEALVSNYNVWYNQAATPYVGTYFTTLALWQTERSDDLNSIDGNPLAVNSPTDYRLQYGSSAIDAGVDVGLTRDILGNLITGTPDIGAYEFIDDGDVTAPVVTAFTIPATSTLFTISVSTFTATDNIAVTGYLITESSTSPLASNTEWAATAPTSYTFTTTGSKTLYAWARDKNGNVSSYISDTVEITVLEVDRYIAGLTTSLSDEMVDILEEFAFRLKDTLSIDSLSEYFDAMYILGNETQEAGLRNFVKRAHDATVPEGITFNDYTGMNGNGSSQYLDLNFNPSTQGVNYTLNSASLGYESLTNVSGSYHDIGARTSVNSNRIVLISDNAGSSYVNINTDDGQFVAATGTIGFFIGTRTSSTATQGYKNGTSMNVPQSNSSGLPNTNIVLGAMNTAGTVASYNPRVYSFAFIGKGLTASEVAKLNFLAAWLQAAISALE